MGSSGGSAPAADCLSCVLCLRTPQPCLRQALYRMSSGQVTFASNATVAAAAAAAAANATAAAAAPGDARAGAVDVYGWAVLDKMRGDSNVCYDWCQDAMEQLGVSARSHKHYVCFPLYRPDQPGVGAPAVCDNACPDNGECPASCPRDGPYRDLPGVSGAGGGAGGGGEHGGRGTRGRVHGRRGGPRRCKWPAGPLPPLTRSPPPPPPPAPRAAAAPATGRGARSGAAAPCRRGARATGCV
jgi:hypothetical protein